MLSGRPRQVASVQLRLVSLAIVIASGGCFEAPEAGPCDLPLVGDYEVTSWTLDDPGCSDGAAGAPPSRFTIGSCPDGSMSVSTTGTPSCLEGANQLMRREQANACSGERGVTWVVDRQGRSACGQMMWRVDAAIEGDRVVVTLRTFSEVGDAAIASQCPSTAGWLDGTRAPACFRREEIVGRRLP